MINALKLFFVNYVNFSGRSRRSEYWYAILGIYIVEFLLYMVAGTGVFMASLGGDAGTIVASATVPSILLILFSLAIMIPSLSLTIRRYHDIGKSGWWIFISLVPCIGTILTLIFMCTDSQPGMNQWGPNPKENNYY